MDIGEGSFTGRVAEHGEPILANDALGDPRGHTIEGTDDIEESMLVVPMMFEGRAVGVIASPSWARDQFCTDDQQTMTIFAGYAAQAIANARSYAQLELTVRRSSPASCSRSGASSRSTSGCSRPSTRRTCSTPSPTGCAAWSAYDNLSIYRVDHAAPGPGPRC